MENREYISCMCHSFEHDIRVDRDPNPDDPLIYIHFFVHQNRSLWGRIKYAIKYILGINDSTGEMIIDEENAKKLGEFLLQSSEVDNEST